MITQHSIVRVQGNQRGFTLIEILIALLLGVFMLAALLTIVQANRVAYGDQNQLAQLQDNERMAMTLMTDIIQSAGYFPVSTPPATAPTNTLDTSLTATTGDGYAFAVGQPMYGTYSATVPGDAIYVRYMTASGDGVLNCSGLSNTTGANQLYVNKFYIDSTGQLVCNMNGTIYNLVSGVTNSTTNLGVTNLTILYGVKADAAFLGNNADTYMNASQVTDWSSVISVMIELTFTNPLYKTSGTTTQPATVYIQRVVGVMSQLGPVQ
jgi:type IV pilus assembly protein PilW